MRIPPDYEKIYEQLVTEMIRVETFPRARIKIKDICFIIIRLTTSQRPRSDEKETTGFFNCFFLINHLLYKNHPSDNFCAFTALSGKGQTYVQSQLSTVL